jgi:hypothetical protein
MHLGCLRGVCVEKAGTEGISKSSRKGKMIACLQGPITPKAAVAGAQKP